MRAPRPLALRDRWGRMSWHAREQFMRDLIARERRAEALERPCACMQPDPDAGHRTPPDAAATRRDADRILALLPADDPLVTAERREAMLRATRRRMQ